MSNNLLSNVPSAVFELDSLEVLALDHNTLETLPENLSNPPPRLHYLSLHNNPLPIPSEILSQDTNPGVILDYIVRTRKDRRPLDEAKLLVVGEGAVGKSSIIRRLTRGDFDPDERKTEGIEITRWSLAVDGNDITVNVWDVGGQEIMHASHQFFLTRRSIYLLVIDARQGEEQNRIEYWLKLIQGFSSGSPVILVGNKCENFGLDIDRRGLRGKYPEITNIIETSCVDNVGVDAVRRSLTRAIGDLAHVRDLLPSSFLRSRSTWSNSTRTTCRSPITSGYAESAESTLRVHRNSSLASCMISAPSSVSVTIRGCATPTSSARAGLPAACTDS